jgi:hypothetical protein
LQAAVNLGLAVVPIPAVAKGGKKVAGKAVKALTNRLSLPDGMSAALDMSKAARMARAAEQGFDVPAYHGTGRVFGEFSAAERGSNFPGYSVGTYAASNPEEAARYAIGDGANVRPVQLRMNNPYIVSDPRLASAIVVDQDRWHALAEARRLGSDGIVGVGRNGDKPYVALDPSNIRSQFDEFHPGGEARIGLPRPGDFRSPNLFRQPGQ